MYRWMVVKYHINIVLILQQIISLHFDFVSNMNLKMCPISLSSPLGPSKV